MRWQHCRLPAITNLIFGKEESDRKSSANCVGSSSNSSIPSMKRQILSRMRKGTRNGVLLMVPSVQVGSKKDLHSGRAPAFPPASTSGVTGLNVQQPSPQALPMVRASSDVLGSKAALAISGRATYITPDQILCGLRRVPQRKGKAGGVLQESRSCTITHAKEIEFD
jgi:hypothetical protein